MRTGDPGITQEVDKDFVAISYIVRTHGIKGDVKVIPLTDIPDRYASLKKIYIHTRSGEKREYFLKEIKKAKGGLIVAFTPTITVSEAEGLVGGYITVPETEVPRLEKDSYYHFEIIDMEVYGDDGRYLGKIADIFSTGANDVYVVRGENREYLIPAIHDVIKEVDIKDKRMVITLIEGLI